jgi:hypothetical protein
MSMKKGRPSLYDLLFLGTPRELLNQMLDNSVTILNY